jgi:hypothetical protein
MEPQLAGTRGVGAISRVEGVDELVKLRTRRRSVVVGDRVVQIPVPRRRGEHQQELSDPFEIASPARVANERHDRAIGVEIDTGFGDIRHR